MTSFVSSISRKFAELVYRLEGRPVVHEAPEMRTKPGGVFGAYLQAGDEARLEKLLEKMSLTPMGSALVEYAQDRLKSFGMTRVRDGSGGRYSTALAIGLESNEPEGFLIGALAHELRHARQHELIGELFRMLYLPPDAAIIINRFLEADAYTFQQKFCEDYAEKTGDQRPLKAFFKIMKADAGLTESLKLVKDDATRFLIWAEKITENSFAGNSYDAGMLSYLLDVQKDRDAGDSLRSMISPKVSNKLVLAAARQIDSCWPLKPQSGIKEHYLSDFSDAQLLNKSLTRMPKYDGLDDLMRAYAADYARKHATNKGAPAVSAAGAPSMKPGK